MWIHVYLMISIYSPFLERFFGLKNTDKFKMARLLIILLVSILITLAH